MTATQISSHQDIIDVRDVIARFEELEEMGAADMPGDDEGREFQGLQQLLGELKGYGGDEQWRGDWYPVTLIRDSYFVDAMKDLCEDIGDFPKGIPSYYVIDWEATAKNLRVDYSSVDFDGVTYWYR
jgi:hypothetical protein